LQFTRSGESFGSPETNAGRLEASVRVAAPLEFFAQKVQICAAVEKESGLAVGKRL